MRGLRRFLLLISAGAAVFMLPARGQDAPPSLGDVARQSRLHKQQKDAQTKDGQGPTKDTQPAAGDATTQGKAVPSKDAPGKDAQDKDAAAKDAQPKSAKKVITNDEIPEHIGPTSTAAGSKTQNVNYPQPSYGEGKAPAEYWKNQIEAQKSAILNLQDAIKNVSDSIQYAGANCVSGCVQWNERQQQKQQQVEVMKSQLEEAQKRLEDMQEMARKQGYGSSVYEP